jgi:ribosomal protein L25 (general stress protein Ctc)
VTHLEGSKEYMRKYMRKNWRKYDRKLLTADEYTEMHKAQGGVCAICGGRGKSEVLLCIDHDHVTGKVRGLLCRNCNVMLGMAGDNPSILLLGALYLTGKNK